MSDIDLSLPSSLSPDHGGAETGGSLLRQAREASGLSVPALASLLKVSTAKLDALESNRWELLPDIVFARALASSVCRALQIEVEPVLAHFPSLVTPSMKTDESGINTPFRVSGDGVGFAWVSQLGKPGTLAVLALIIAAVALFLLPGDLLKSWFQGSAAGVGDVSESLSGPVSSEVLPVFSDQTPSISVAGPQLSAASQIAPETSNPTIVSERVAASPLPLTVAGSGALAGTVVLKATGASWVEVVDARGVVQVRKTMAKDEVVGASGEGPLSVVIGRADAVAVEVRGKSFDLASSTKNNVARFEVK